MMKKRRVYREWLNRKKKIISDWQKDHFKFYAVNNLQRLGAMLTKVSAIRRQLQLYRLRYIKDDEILDIPVKYCGAGFYIWGHNMEVVQKACDALHHLEYK